MSFKIQQGLFKLDIVDHYAILGISLDSDTKQIRQRYLKIAQRLHPDTCKATSNAEKQQANQILSKLVNPAYEQLSKDVTRTEYLLILSQMGKTLTLDGGKITLVSESAKQLAQAINNADQLYKKLLQSLALEQYTSIDKILGTIAQISELNLVYLMLKQGQIAPVKATQTFAAKPAAESQVKKTEPETPVSPVASYIRRAQEYLDRKNSAQAIVEMRDALKIEPNNSTCHGLMGLAYLQQNQMTMAKVHINKAWQANPKDPIAMKAKQELNKLVPSEDSKSKTSAERSSSSGFLGGLFGGKKK
ncbi:MAG: DnaJ domain-containing protein [Hydrococcus sp. C42_A2020_068]|nr:DnaJ domain-containing protein [Hydrococcus sp. C42_A2020_068]